MLLHSKRKVTARLCFLNSAWNLDLIWLVQFGERSLVLEIAISAATHTR